MPYICNPRLCWASITFLCREAISNCRSDWAATPRSQSSAQERSVPLPFHKWTSHPDGNVNESSIARPQTVRVQAVAVPGPTTRGKSRRTQACVQLPEHGQIRGLPEILTMDNQFNTLREHGAVCSVLYLLGTTITDFRPNNRAPCPPLRKVPRVAAITPSSPGWLLLQLAM